MATDPRIPVLNHNGVVDMTPSRDMQYPLRCYGSTRYRLLPPPAPPVAEQPRKHPKGRRCKSPTCSSSASFRRSTTYVKLTGRVRSPQQASFNQTLRVQSKHVSTEALETPPRTPVSARSTTSTTPSSTHNAHARSHPGFVPAASRYGVSSPSAASEQRSSSGTCSSSTMRFDHSTAIPPEFRAKSNVKGRWKRMMTKVSKGVAVVVTTFYH